MKFAFTSNSPIANCVTFSRWVPISNDLPALKQEKKILSSSFQRLFYSSGDAINRIHRHLQRNNATSTINWYMVISFNFRVVAAAKRTRFHKGVTTTRARAQYRTVRLRRRNARIIHIRSAPTTSLGLKLTTTNSRITIIFRKCTRKTIVNYQSRK